MKHIPLGQEPAYLATYRQNNPHGIWDDFKNEVSAYQALLDEMIKRQYGLCAYCEIDLKNDGVTIDQLVEHFHPKQDSNESHNWGLDFHNLLLCCKGGSYPYHPKGEEEGRFLKPPSKNHSCDHKKGKKRPYEICILHPNDVPKFPIIFRLERKNLDSDFPEALLLPHEENCQAANIPADRVQKTIDELGLNCERLRRIRGKVLDEIDEQLNLILQSDGNPKDLISKFLSPIPQTKDTLWPFFTTIRLYFGTEGEKFLLQNYPNYSYS
ncbi:MAG: TIGR02646 family protein [Candidatus Parabeggiatoa sp. nov. 2]|nr:MAG: TIGR02646 family protein [Beggiatoa sp. 4572_84]RKZ59876.1 MAG: TIGR02646 family protein [Gammaproteobacteria bacterium]